MNTAATTSEIAPSDRKESPLRGQKYSDVVSPEQLAALDEIVGPIDESQLEDIRQRRW